MDMDLLQRDALYGNLVRLGNFYSLTGMINPYLFEEELKEFENDWHQYNPDKPHIRREGLSLTSLDGEMTGEELTSLYEFNKKNNSKFGELDFTKPTAALKKMTSLHPGIEPFIPHLGRTHLLRLGEGGYFPPHRDAQELGANSFRLVSLVQNCDPEHFHFIYDDQKIHLTPGRIYFMNTKITHSLISFSYDAIIFVANVRLNEESARCVLKQLECT